MASALPKKLLGELNPRADSAGLILIEMLTRNEGKKR